MAGRVLRTLVRQHRRALRDSPGRAVAVVATIALATALPVGVLVLAGSIDATVEALTAPAEHVDLLIEAVAPGSLTEADLVRVQDLDGVLAAAPMIEQEVVIGRRPTTLYGSNLRLDELAGDFEDLFASRASAYREHPGLLFTGIFLGQRVADEVGVEVGDTISVRGASQTVDQVVLDVIEDDFFNGGAFAFGLQAHVRDLAGRDRDTMDLILVRAAESPDLVVLRERLADVVGTAGQVSSPSVRASAAMANVRGPLRLLVFLALLTAGIGAFLLGGLSLLLVEQRRAQLGLLRALGADASSLVRGLVGEVSVLAVVAVPIGLALGTSVGGALVRRLPTSLFSRFEVQVLVARPAATVPLAFLLALGVAVLATRGPARAAATAPPMESMRPVERRGTSNLIVLHPRGLVLGTSAVAVGLALVFGFGPGIESSPPGLISVLLVGGLVWATRAGRSWLVGLGRRLLPGRRPSVHLARAAITNSPDRFWSIATAVALGVLVAVATSGMTADVERELFHRYASWRDVGVVVEAGALDAPPTNRALPAQAVEVVASYAGDPALVTELWRGSAALRGLRVQVVAASGPTGHPAFARLTSEELARVQRGAAVAVSPSVADVLARSGQRHVLPLATGPLAVEAFVIDLPPLTSDGTVLVDVATHRRWLGALGPSAIELTAPGVDRAGLAEAVHRLDQTLTVRSGAEVADGHERDAGLLIGIFSSIEVLVLFGSGAALFGLQATAVTQRRRELGLLRVVGADRSVLRTAVVLEAAAAGMVGAALGVPLGLVLHRAGTGTLAELVRFSIGYQASLGGMVSALGLAVAAVAAGALIPAHLASRVPVLEAIAAE